MRYRQLRGAGCFTTFSMLAVIRTGGKQYLVSPGRKIKIEKVETKEGKEITFNEVLLLAYSPLDSARLREKGKKIEIGTPLIKGAKVVGKIVRHGKAKKVIIFKYKPKKRYKKKVGHRQPFTEIEITKIQDTITKQ